MSCGGCGEWLDRQALMPWELAGLYRTACRTLAGSWPSRGLPLLLWAFW